MFDLSINERDLTAADDLLNESSADLFADAASRIPDEARLLFQTQVSAPGTPPRRRSGNLDRSLGINLVGDFEAELSMAYYAEFLDPVFGGNLNRPFLEQAVTKSLIAAPRKL